MSVMEKKKEALESINQGRPYALQVQMMQILYDIADMLESLNERMALMHKDLLSMTPKGDVVPYAFEVTEKRIEVSTKQYSDMPWIAFTLCNDGPDPVYYTVNKEYEVNKAPLANGEHQIIDMKKPLIEKIILWCDKGKRANVRIYALR
jgi:hypothetical protein